MRGNSNQLLLALLAWTATVSAVVAAAEWNVGDIFVGSHGRVHVIDGKTQVAKDKLMLFNKKGKVLCPGWITGGAFNAQGTILYLTCHHQGLVIAVDAANSKHAVIAAFKSGAYPESIAIDKSGNLFVGHAGGDRLVYKHSPSGELLQTLRVDASSPGGTNWLALDKNGTRLLSTSQGPQVHAFDLAANKPLAQLASLPGPDTKAVTSAADPNAPATKCFGLQPLQDGSVLVACKACMYRVDAAAAAAANASGGAPVQPAFCAPAGAPDDDEPPSLKTLALDPSGEHVYIADSSTAKVYKVRTKDAAPANVVSSFVVEGTRKIHGLTVLRAVNDTAVAAARAAPPQGIEGPGGPKKNATRQVGQGQAKKPRELKPRR